MPEDTHRTDLLVIGGGPGGYAAAFRSADLGVPVTLVEADERLGGTCLLRGCIPSKALLHVASLISESREAAACGLTFAEPEIDLDKMRKWKDGILARLSRGLDALCKRRKVTRVRGRAAFESSSRVRISGNDDVSHIDFVHAIVATGSRPAVPPVFAIDSSKILDSDRALELDHIPDRLLAVGGGIIGLELSTVYAQLGSRVTLVEITGGLLPGVDRDLVKPLQIRLQGVFDGIHCNTAVADLEDDGGGVTASFEGDYRDGPRSFDNILVSAGRVPNTENLGLEHTRVGLSDAGFIVVDDRLRTADSRIFALGDVVDGPGLAHKAAHQGKVAAEVIAGQPAAFDGVVPSVVYTDPEIAWCGLTETLAREQDRPVKIARYPWAASGRAATLGRTEGLTKLIFDPETRRVLGAGIVGPNAGELIAEAVLGIEMAAVAEDLSHTIHPHPSLSESLGIAAEIHLGTATDLYIPKRR